MKNFLLLILGIVLVALLSIICFNKKLEPIKEYVISSTQSKLDKNGIHGLNVEMVGEGYKTELATRISGVVLSDDKKEKALELAESMESVFYVEDGIKVEKPKVIKKRLVFEPVVESCQDRLNKLLSENKINFKSGSSIIDIESFELLNKISKVIKECNDELSKIEIAGYTDSSGSSKSNKLLSQNRAEAVKTYIVDKGISEKLLEAVGYGSQNPIAGNDTVEGRAKNRRIEFKLIK